jgi:hypothetical protein
MTSSPARRHLRGEIAVAKYVVAPADAISPVSIEDAYLVVTKAGAERRTPKRTCTSLPIAPPFRTGGHVI